MKIKFKQAGKYMNTPREPIMEVEAGEIADVSDYLAKHLLAAGKAEIVNDQQEKPAEKEPAEAPTVDEAEPEKKKRGRPKKTPATKDKAAAKGE